MNTKILKSPSRLKNLNHERYFAYWQIPQHPVTPERVTLGSVWVRAGGGGGVGRGRAGVQAHERARCGGVGRRFLGAVLRQAVVGAHHGAEQELPVEADDPAAAGVVLGARLQLVAQLAAPEAAAAEETGATAAAGVGERAAGRAALPGVPDVPRAAQRAARTLHRPLLQQGRYVAPLSLPLTQISHENCLLLN